MSHDAPTPGFPSINHHEVPQQKPRLYQTKRPRSRLSSGPGSPSRSHTRVPSSCLFHPTWHSCAQSSRSRHHTHRSYPCAPAPLAGTRFFVFFKRAARTSSCHSPPSPPHLDRTDRALTGHLALQPIRTPRRKSRFFFLVQQHNIHILAVSMARSMESVDGNNGGGLVVTELSHIKELVRQLEVHIGGEHELCKMLASQIFSLTERSISIITSSSLDGPKRSTADAGLASPLSAAPTPTSGVTGPFKKKRKVMEKRRHQVRVSSPTGDNPVDDGHSWRKYGQKEILGAKNPRGYYRCTHRHSQGCMATKQVQRTDEDSTLFDVIYHGQHTCVQRPPAAAAGQPEHNPDANSLLQSLTAGLTVKTEGLPPLAPFYFASSTPVTSGCLATAAERSPFSAAPSASENWGVSPSTSDSNHVASYLPFEDAEWRGQNELQEVVSALVAASAPQAPAMDSLDELLDIDIASFFA